MKSTNIIIVAIIVSSVLFSFSAANIIITRVAKKLFDYELKILTVFTSVSYLIFACMALLIFVTVAKGFACYAVPLFFLSFSPWMLLFYSYVFGQLGSMALVFIPVMACYIALLCIVELVAFTIFLKTKDGKSLNPAKAISLALRWIVVFIFPVFFLPALKKDEQT